MITTASHPQDQLPLIVLCIPGSWDSRADLCAGVMDSGRFLVLGNTLLDQQAQKHVEVEAQGRDDRLEKAFRIAGGGRIPEADMAAIASHRMVLYVIGEGGSLDAARFLCAAADAILAAGGLAVKVESSGIAHSKSRWLEIPGPEFSPALFNRFVVFVGDHSRTYSCGMHALGFRDGIIPKPLSDESVNELRVFLLYAMDPPKPLLHGDTVGPSEHMGAYRLHLTECETHPADDLFYNSYGMMRLEPR